MSDVLQVLHGLRVGPDGAPEPVERLRERILARRRRRRRALVGSVTVVVLAAASVFVAVDDEGGRTVRTVDDPTTVPSTLGPRSSSRLPEGSVVSGVAGIEQVAASGGLVRVSDQPTARAFAINDLVVAQGAEVGDFYPLRARGPVVILDVGGQRELLADPDQELTLHDVGMVDNRAVAVVTAQRGVGPEDTDERLLLVDLETGERDDLGSVGGWESGVAQARIAGDRISTLAAVSVDQRVVVRSLDGTVLWEASESVVDRNVSVTIDGDQVLQLEPALVGDEFDPQLKVTRYDLSSGTRISSEALALKPASGLEIEGGFCFAPDASAGRLVCGQTYGGPIEIDLATGNTTSIAGVDHGVPTLPRDPFTRPVGSAGDPSTPAWVNVTFDPPVGVPGARLTATFTGLDELAGRDVNLWIWTLNGVTTGGAGSGRVDDEGRLIVDLDVPNVIEHDYEVTPGRYTVSVRAPGNGPGVDVYLDIEEAQIGVPYRHQPGYECPDYMWFDQRLWIATPASTLDWSAGPPAGTFEMEARDSAFFATKTDTVHYRGATQEERAAFDPEMFQCPT